MAQGPGGGGFLKVLFWGTPLFSLPYLYGLSAGGHELVGVVTQPDKPQGRGRKLASSPVKAAALEAGVPVFTPDRPQGPDFLAELQALAPDISVVVAYGHILRTEFLDLPPLGSINVHASLLPELRGAGPVNWAILQGMKTTGVTIMRMVEAMDAGPVLLRHAVPIGPRETASELGVRLSEGGVPTLLAALEGLAAGTLQEEEQDHALATFAPKVSREMARIDWARPARALGFHLRGFDTVPGAWTTLDGEAVKLFGPEPREDDLQDSPPGTILEGSPREGLLVACGEGALRVLEAQPQGKRRMPVSDWLRGRPLDEGAFFE